MGDNKCIFDNCCGKTSPTGEFCQLVSNGAYTQVLSAENLNIVLGLECIQNVESWQSHIQHHIKEYIKTGDKIERYQKVLAIGVASLQLFAQINWVGPPSEWDENVLIPTKCRKKESSWNSYIRSLLQVDGEPIYTLAEKPSLLALAHTILTMESLFSIMATQVWLLRCLKVQQELLSEKCSTIHAKVKQVINQVGSSSLLHNSDLHRKFQIAFHIEATHLLYYYYESVLAEEQINKAQDLTGLNIELTGALGKRTRFQEKEVSQLLLSVIPNKQYRQTTTEKEQCKTILPTNIPMDDDTVLETVQFSKEQSNESDSTVQIIPLEQALVLGLLYHHRKTHEGIGDILKEESMAYVNYVLSQPCCWCVQMKALIFRSQWETGNARRLQRCMAQLEELVHQYSRSEPPAHVRMNLLHCVQLQPKWNTEHQLADLLLHTGMTTSALDIYLRLEMWEEVIKCYATLGRTEKAENVIRAQLQLMETPTLYCYLGDVTNDPQHYEKAWELSNGKNSRSQRSLGYYHLRKSEFSECLPHFQKSLGINSLQIGVWFSYGCAALAGKNFSLAATAFNRCVTLEPNNFEAWNNLATAYVRNNQKARAFTALQEAIKCEYENWRLWENLLVIGSDIGEFVEVIRAYHRMLDIKDKYVDSQVLNILVRAVNENLNDAHDKASAELRPQVQELFGRLTSKVTTDGKVWQLYTDLLQGKPDLSIQDKEKALQYLHKSHRCNTQTQGWEREAEKCKEIGAQSLSLAQAYIDSCEELSESVQVIQKLSSARLMLKGVLAKIKMKHTDPLSQEIIGELRQILEDLENKLKQIETLLSQHKTMS